jgi:transcriptional regulator with XRE-family HTH domain
MAQRDQEFGQRVRAARAYEGISQTELAARITETFPDNPVSAATIKRLERNDPSVKGEQDLWVRLIVGTTTAPPWFLRFGWGAFERIYGRALEGARRYKVDDILGDLRFRVLDVDFENLHHAAESAAELSGAAKEVEDLVGAFVSQGHGDLGPGGSAIRSAVAHAFNDLPVTRNQIQWVAALVSRRLRELIDGELQRLAVSTTGEQDRLIHTLVDQIRSDPDVNEKFVALAEETSDILERANHDVRKALVRSTVERFQTERHAITPRSAADDFLPPPGGGLASGPQAPRPSAEGRKPSQTPEEPDAPQANRG